MDVGSLTALALVLLTSTILMVIFHDRFWAPADEGIYAHVADRLLAGQVLHRDIQDLHAGYIDFVNAAAFSIFGVRMVSLRYPLAMLTVVQSGLMFLLLRPRGLLIAVVGALALTSLTFVQFLNPTANWYALFLAICTITWLAWVPPGHAGRHFVLGLLVGTTFLFRQLSGVILAVGVLVFLVLERQDSQGDRRADLPRGLLAVSAIGLAGYLLRVTDPVGWVLLGVWPLPVLFYAWRRTTMPSREFAKALLALSLGGVAAALPLLAYHVAHGSLRYWFQDSFGAATSLPGLDFMRRPGYLMMGILAWRGFHAANAAAYLNAAFWTLLLLLPAFFGLVWLVTLARGRTASRIHPLPVIASIYSLVSIHYQLPIYLFYTIGLMLSAILWLMADRSVLSRVLGLIGSVFVTGVALYYQAAMVTPSLQGVVAGEGRFPTTLLQLPVAGIYVDSADAELYERLVQLTERETQPGDTIFAFPTNAEIYFLSRRTNPFRFYNTALGLRSSADLEATLRVIRCHPPKLVFFNQDDKYNTPASARIAAVVQAQYPRLETVPPFQVFRRPIDSSLVNGAEHGCSTQRSERPPR